MFSFLFSESFRKTAFTMLLFGSTLHLIVDLLKTTIGIGAIYPFFPISNNGYEAGLYYSEDIVYLIPIDIAVIAVLWITTLFKRGNCVQQ